MNRSTFIANRVVDIVTCCFMLYAIIIDNIIFTEPAYTPAFIVATILLVFRYIAVYFGI